jgi:hypothetical protein
MLLCRYDLLCIVFCNVVQYSVVVLARMVCIAKSVIAVELSFIVEYYQRD